MLKYVIGVAFIAGLAMADQVDKQNIDHLTAREASDTYGAPSAPSLSGGGWEPVGSSNSYDSGYPASGYPTSYSADAGGAYYQSNAPGVGFGANAGIGSGLSDIALTILYGIVVIMGLTSVAQLVVKVMNSAFVDGLFGGDARAFAFDPETVNSVMNMITQMQEKFA
jgi:hypothetical protein